MSSKEKLISYLPTYYRKNKVFNDLLESCAQEIQVSNDNDEDVLKQMFPQTATWGLKYWEELCGIHSNDEIPINQRRSIVISKLSQTSPTTKYRMQQIIKVFATEVQIDTRHSEYAFDAILKTKGQFNANVQEIAKVIDDIKPAHLGYTLQFEYINNSEVQTDYNYHFFNYPVTNTYSCGTYSNKSTLGKVINIKQNIKPEIKSYSFDYIPCGTSFCGQ